MVSRMRWLLIPLVLVTVAALAFAANGDPPQVRSACTWTGTNVRDVKTGSPGDDVLCALPGNDYIHGRAGADRLRAGDGRDVAVGGGGRDIIRGGRGPDRLFAVDDRGGDKVIGGPGDDQCFADSGDTVFGCERPFLSDEPAMAEALSQSLGQVMEIIELEPTPTIPPVTVTITQTRTVSFPPCSPPPPITPSPC